MVRPKVKHFCLSVLFTAGVLAGVSCSQEAKDAGLPENMDLDIQLDSEQETEDLTPPAPVLVTTEQQLDYMRSDPDSARYETGILPQMAEDVPEYCEKLLTSEYPRFIIVDKAKMKLFLYDRYGNIEKEYGIACAKNFGHKVKRRDGRTSEGFFSAEGIYDSTEWLFTDDDGNTSEKKGQFGPRFIRLKIPNTTQIGIHGTCSPWSIGHRCSHGCIRVTNENILELVDFVEVGMPIIVSPGSRDMAVNASEGRFIPSVVTVPGGKRVKGPAVVAAKPAEDSEGEATVEDTTAPEEITSEGAPESFETMPEERVVETDKSNTQTPAIEE